MSDDDRDETPFEGDTVELPPQDWLDLHPFRPRDVRSVVEAYLEQALEAGFTEVRIVHGRGIGVQREMVRALLEKHPDVDGYGDAPSGRGGWGATIARLRPRDDD